MFGHLEADKVTALDAMVVVTSVAVRIPSRTTASKDGLVVVLAGDHFTIVSIGPIAVAGGVQELISKFAWAAANLLRKLKPFTPGSHSFI